MGRAATSMHISCYCLALSVSRLTIEAQAYWLLLKVETRREIAHCAVLSRAVISGPAVVHHSRSSFTGLLMCGYPPSLRCAAWHQGGLKDMMSQPTAHDDGVQPLPASEGALRECSLPLLP